MSDVRRLNRDDVMEMWRLDGCEDFVSDRRLYSMHLVILSHWRERRMGVILQDSEALTRVYDGKL